MTRFSQFGVFVLMLSVSGLLVLAAPARVQAAGNDYRYESWLNPRDPFVGEDYALFVKITNTSTRYIEISTTVTSLPLGDLLLSPTTQRVVIAPGGSYTVRFDINCGVRGGRVLYNVKAAWAD